MRENQASIRRSWAAIIIAGLAMVISAYQAFDSHQQSLLTRMPLLDFDIEDDENSKPLGLAVRNNGSGGAQIKEVLYYVDDGSVLNDSVAALTAGKFDVKEDAGNEIVAGNSVAVGEQIWLFNFRGKKQDERRRFADFLDDRLGVKIIYCALGGHPCRFSCSSKLRCGAGP
jgi:hypothetical protein